MSLLLNFLLSYDQSGTNKSLLTIDSFRRWDWYVDPENNLQLTLIQ
jgi:hypothetical protein